MCAAGDSARALHKSSAYFLVLLFAVYPQALHKTPFSLVGKIVGEEDGDTIVAPHLFALANRPCRTRGTIVRLRERVDNLAETRGIQPCRALRSSTRSMEPRSSVQGRVSSAQS